MADDLNARYKAWDAWASKQSGSSSAPTLKKEDLKDVTFSLGTPMSEEQFKEHRRKHGSKVVATKKF